MIEVRRCEVTEAEAEAVVCPVATDLSPVCPASRALELAAGVGWIERRRAAGELPLGSAAITDAGELSAEFVIHAAVRSSEEPVSARTVEAGVRNALRRAREWGIPRVALPLVGTGPGNLDPEAACRAIDGALRGISSEAGEVHLIVCCRDGFEAEAARRRWGG